ncbi:hypothetical protein QBC47DRAFT_385208 [Echria macrotheca]|uniref:Steroid 5-alpha reductase C-terminal domain-containing protein n=1 Tax=Echria macrotheca TaxID=438768 RepID=A0AAJ0B914_9PEZI|nr:hypothetical protein QBC47DRAFT_385208 [Echria macrotheca]
MPLLHALLSATDFPSSAFLSNLAPAALAAFSVQTLFGINGVLRHSEFLYDFSGGWTFLVTLTASFLVPAIRRDASAHVSDVIDAANWRQLFMTGAVLVYAVRLSSYLFIRILKRGHDSRFHATKHKPRRFFIFWMVQAVWVVLCCMPVIAINTVHPAAFKAGLGVPTLLRSDVIGVGLFVFGFAVEMVADYQKAVWHDQRQKKLHDEQFMTRGIWGRSRYPNYFGDITLWIGMAILASGVLRQGPIQANLGWYGLPGQLKAVLLPAAAPAFVAWALLRVTGVPLSEAKYDKLYGERKDYQQWRQSTPLLIPKLF